MKKEVQPGGLYKIKEGKTLCEADELLSPYVRMLGFALNPLKKDDCYVEFVYVYKDTLEETTRIHPIKILPYDVFFEYFNLELSSKEVNSIILGLNNM